MACYFTCFMSWYSTNQLHQSNQQNFNHKQLGPRPLKLMDDFENLNIEEYHDITSFFKWILYFFITRLNHPSIKHHLMPNI